MEHLGSRAWAEVRWLYAAAAEHRREEPGELHGLPIRLATVSVSAEALPAPGRLGRGVEAERKGEGLVPRGPAAPRRRGGVGAAGHGEELVKKVVLRPLRRRLPGHASGRGARPSLRRRQPPARSLSGCRRRPGTEAVC
uniref:Uncharacterized protein n=1 Tax=Arundo donax TaxID=35708 RepID=A0A0A9G4A8_ARUDO